MAINKNPNRAIQVKPKRVCDEIETMVVKEKASKEIPKNQLKVSGSGEEVAEKKQPKQQSSSCSSSELSSPWHPCFRRRRERERERERKEEDEDTIRV